MYYIKLDITKSFHVISIIDDDETHFQYLTSLFM